MRARATRTVERLGVVAVGAVPLVLVPALGRVQGGYFPHSWVWTTPVAAAAYGALLSRSFGGGLRRGWLWAVAALALLAWTAASALWSANSSQSVLEARRAVLYASVVLALLALARRGSASALVAGTHAGVSGLLVYALARHLLGAQHYYAFEGALLAQPLGYANAVGILAVLGLLLGVHLAMDAGRHAHRLAAAAALPLLVLALSLTGSWGSVLALAAGGAVAVALGNARSVVGAVVAAGPGSVVLVALAAALGFTNGHVAPPRRDGALLAAIAVAVALATALAASRLRGRVPAFRPSRRIALALLAAAAVVAVAGIAAAGASQPRSGYWHVAWQREIASRPLGGTGAGTFGFFWMRSKIVLTLGGALDAHSLYVETLAELGLVGLVLLAAFLLLPLRGLRRRDGPMTAAAAAYVAFLVHAGVDWDWELPAVTIAALACGAALLLGDGEQPDPPPPAARAAALAAALALGAIGLAGTRSTTVPAAAPARPPIRERALPHGPLAIGRTTSR